MQRIVSKMTPANQRGFKKAMRGFIDYCLSHNLMNVDPLTTVKLAKMKDTGGFRTWEEITAYENRESTTIPPKTPLCRPASWADLALARAMSRAAVARSRLAWETAPFGRRRSVRS